VIDGVLVIDKPAGLTSHDVVARVRRAAGQSRVGHAGTLDPAATGVLVCALGAATRLIEMIQDETVKVYRAVVQLGATTSTDDAEGAVLATAPVPPLDVALLEVALAPFRGAIMQVPPMVSALHHQGQRLYQLARAGQIVERAARPALIHRLTLLELQASRVSLEVACGKGTYIRSLARDLGERLGCGAHLAALQRTAVGTFVLADALPLAALDGREAVLAHCLPPTVALAGWAPLALDAAACAALRHGRTIPAAADPALTRAYACDAGGGLVALLERDGAHWRPRKVFGHEP
jgi:tRNA pseudouridine55 synthase